MHDFQGHLVFSLDRHDQFHFSLVCSFETCVPCLVISLSTGSPVEPVGTCRLSLPPSSCIRDLRPDVFDCSGVGDVGVDSVNISVLFRLSSSDNSAQHGNKRAGP